jgi:adenosylcobyric acid synthase
LGRPAAVILPGTKHTLADLAWLRGTGLADAIVAWAASGGAVVGICGGYQMLGEAIIDPLGVEGGGEAAGLGLLPVRVTFGQEKATWQARAVVRGDLAWLPGGAAPLALAHVYEIHAGQATSPAPLFEISRSNGETVLDGAASAGGRVWGTHLHGLFHNDAFRRAWLRSLGWRPTADVVAAVRRSAAYDRLADVLEATLDVAQLDRIIGL